LLLVLLAGAVHSLSLAEESLATHNHPAAEATFDAGYTAGYHAAIRDRSAGNPTKARQNFNAIDTNSDGTITRQEFQKDRVWLGAYNMTHADEISPADSAPCEQVFGADPLWSESSPQTKCPWHKSLHRICTLPFANITTHTAERWSTSNCATCRKLLWKLPYPTINQVKAQPQYLASWLKVGERYLQPRSSCTSCKPGSVLIMDSVHDRVGSCFKFSPGSNTSSHRSIVGITPFEKSVKLSSVITGHYISRAPVMSNTKLMTKTVVSELILPIWSLGSDTAATAAKTWFNDSGVIGNHSCSKVTCYARKQVQCSGNVCDVRKIVQCANICQAWKGPAAKCSPELCSGKFGHVACKEMTSMF